MSQRVHARGAAVGVVVCSFVILRPIMLSGGRDVRVAEGSVGSKVCLVTYGIHIGPQIDVFPCL